MAVAPTPDAAQPTSELTPTIAVLSPFEAQDVGELEVVVVHPAFVQHSHR
jgi:hypothetical protein